MKPLLDLDKPVQRRTGEPAEIIKRNAMGNYPVIALTLFKDRGEQVPESYTLRGSYATDGEDSDYDLINVPKPPEVRKVRLWVAVWGSNCVSTHTQRQPLVSEGYRAVKEFNLEVEVP